MQKLAEICIRRPVFAAVLMLFLLVIGTFCSFSLSVDRYPKVEMPIVVVYTTLDGAAPEEMETEITNKIEGSVNTISGIDELKSVSSEGVSAVTIQFELEKSIDVAAQEVRDKIAQIRRQLPDDIDEPVVRTFDSDAQPVIGIIVSANRSKREITEYAEKILMRRLENVDGVGQIMMFGGRGRRVNVTADPIRLRSFGLSITDLDRALATENLQIPGGVVKGGPVEHTLRTLGRVPTVEEINTLPVAKKGDYTVLVKDVADVEDGMEAESNYAFCNGQAAVFMIAQKQSGGNTVTTVDNIKKRLKELEPTFPPGYRISTVIDQSIFIKASINNVIEHLIMGAIFAAIVVFFFLKNIRSTIISALAIPISVISTFGAIYIMDYTLNMITLLALTLCVGIVIDDGIVVLENIWRWIEKKGKNAHEAARLGTAEIGLAVLAITISLITVFMPIAFMTGIVGRYMAGFAVTMSCAIAISLFVSFSIVPSLCALTLRRNPNLPPPSEEDMNDVVHFDISPDEESGVIFRTIEKIYMVTLEWLLKHRWVIVVACIVALASTYPIIQVIPKNFTPNEDESQVSISMKSPEGTSIEVMRGIVQRIVNEISNLEGIKDCIMIAGSHSGTGNEGNIMLELVPIEDRPYSQRDLEMYIRTKILPKYVDAYKLRTSIATGPRMSNARESAVEYIIRGPDLNKLKEYSDKVINYLKTECPEALDPDSTLVEGKPQYGVKIDRAKAAELGVSANSIAQALRVMVAGYENSSYIDGGEKYEVWLWANQKTRDYIDALNLMMVPSTTHGTVPLGDVVTIEEGFGPADIRHQSRTRAVTIYSDIVSTGSEQALIDKVVDYVDKLDMPPEYSGALSGRSKELARTLNAFLTVFCMAILLMYLVLAAQFESWLHPITILLVLPLTIPFAFLAILVFGESMNILSILGMLVLFSVVKKNSILQVDRTNQLREAGMNLHDAILQANHDRLRPILMTTIAFVAGMLPLFLSKGTGSATNHTISAVVIGGQTFSLILTLLAVPVAYSYFAQASQSAFWMKCKAIASWPMKVLDGLTEKFFSRNHNNKNDNK
ncbi:MAG: efflux RND transporter permease subunit [Candidatus Sumerlaeales bacterium]|nr:efflux RND transporter permease subunit [Candidatus Sumerlaeales bacterium]